MEKGRTIIVGAGGFGRELIHWAGDCAQAGLLPPVAGLVDDNLKALEGYHYPVSVLSSVADFSPRPEDRLLMAIGTPDIKERVSTILLTRGGRFTSMIHPRAVVAHSARIEEGAILCPLSLVSADANLGRLCTVNSISSIGHDVRIGDYSTLSAHVDLTGSVVVGRGVMIGSGARILPKIKIGDGATIGAGAVVYRGVAAGRSVFAPPAKVLRAPQSAEIASE